MRLSRIAALAGTVVVCALVGGGVSALANAHSASRSVSTVGVPTALPMVSAVPAQQLQAFATLRRPQLTGDILSAAQESSIGTGITGRLGLNTSLARNVSTPEGDAWLIPGNGWVCLAVAGPGPASTVKALGMDCNPEGDAVTGHLVTFAPTLPAGEFTVEGLVPDGITQVVLTSTTGATETVPVSANVYGALLQGPLASVEAGGSLLYSSGA